MDFKTRHLREETEGGSVRFNRLIATVNGHTHMYLFPDNETDNAMEMVRLHVAEGQLHPYAGLILISMMGELE